LIFKNIFPGFNTFSGVIKVSDLEEMKEPGGCNHCNDNEVLPAATNTGKSTGAAACGSPREVVI
jgi:hypothetical protein